MTNLKNGAALVTVLVITAVALLISTPMLYIATSSMRAATRWHDYDECFLTAQSALEKAKWDIYKQFESYYLAPPLSRSLEKFNWFDTWSTNSIGSPGAYSAPQNQDFSNAVISITIKGVQSTSTGKRRVRLNCNCIFKGITRELEEIVSFGMQNSEVFNNAYFINNFGWLWGDSINANGDVRGNGNFSFGSYSPTINGDVYASINPHLGAAGTIDGTPNFWSLNTYYANAPSVARPGDPPSTNYGGSWQMGYDGNSEQFPEQEALDMPYLGDLSDYTWISTQENGRIISNGTNVLVNSTYNGPGPDGIDGTADDGTLILDGTTNTIEIDGPVVVTGDLIIKGEYTGQGTIYAGRNIHVIGDVTSSDPPSWSKPDSTPSSTTTNNADKDILGLAAKGNVVIGDYTTYSWQSSVGNYIQPSFTAGYETDPSDYSLGYDSDWNTNNGYWFNGDYTAWDGGYKMSGTNEVQRSYYESSISDTDFNDLANGVRVEQIDAICYNNHLHGGLVGSSTDGITYNGCIVARDEALIYSGSVNLNWDIRIGSKSPDAIPLDIYLPRTISKPTTEYWSEK
jgi:hypothetical protein